MVLLETQREVFFKKINAIECATKWKVLVVDRKTADIINRFTSVHRLLEEKIAAVEILENARTPNSSFEVLYILHCQDKLVDCIYKDQEYPNSYSGIHIMFIDRIKPQVVDRLKNSSITSKLRSVQIGYLDYFALESRYFQVHDEYSGLRLYHPSSGPIIRQELSNIAHGILSVCVSLGIAPNIRCYYPKTAKHTSKTMSFILASQLRDIVDEYCNTHPGFQESSQKSTCLIVDRSLDVVCPFVHEFTYQAMIHDLLQIKDESYPFTIMGPHGLETRTGKLSDDDSVYVKIRHMHMRDAIERLMADFNKFCEENTIFLDKGQASSLNDMRSMLAGLSDFQELRNEYSLHLAMAQECMNLFEKENLLSIGSVEQDLSTGSNPEGKTPRNVLYDLLPLLEDDSTSEADKLRLLILYITYRDGIILQDLMRLFRHSKLPSHRQEILQNLEQLGVRNVKRLSDSSTKRKEVAKSLPAGEETYELSRFVPTLKAVMESLVQDDLDKELFPFIRDLNPETELEVEQTSLRSSRPSWTRSRSIATRLPKEKFLVFVAGGTTYSELRSCYEISEKLNKNILIGSTSCYSPNEWLEFFSKFRKSREELKFPEDNSEPIPCLQAQPSKLLKQPTVDVPSSPFESTSAPTALPSKEADKKKGKTSKLGKLMSTSKKDKDKDKVLTESNDKKKKKKFGVF
ncbi:SNARE binding protein Sec1 [Schizosaccharomyces cryophilus OY26]|uniref:SNARE binding protein Sec1 n=1 Tax=Schizosaccharomyces cryophilus (strain OY26 / ATCC MYA-4695 / CBS 11777 / NBRC 106824 / NRRL Y48691) TaxID=653667 RepID=S9VYP5_SCHCR|nr:SNARE binding protein Sec1 [Schizosaccharomyces cryophilus OY26]EPY51324.1 SNARE binding protein Sec1 [Schizosaccharomyces cryophilus OY26]